MSSGGREAEEAQSVREEVDRLGVFATAEQRFGAIADSAPAMLWLSTHDGACCFISRSWCDYTGLSEAQAIGDGWLEALHPDDRERVRKAVLDAHATQKPMTFECRLRTASDEFRWVISSGQPRVATTGELLGFIGSIIDVHEHKQAEESLRESEIRFQEMVDGLPLIVWTHDAAGQQELVNLTFCEFFGVSREEMRGGRWQMLMHPEDADDYTREFFNCVEERRPFHAEVRVKRADGQWRNIESWARPRFGPGGEFRGFVGTSADITDRKESEEARRRSEERLNLALLAGHSGAWDWDLVRNEANVSPSYRALYGFPPDLKITYEVWLDAVHPEDRERVRRYGEEFFESGSEWRQEYRIVRSDLGERWMAAVGRLHRDVTGRPLRFVGVQSDVTDQKLAEEALRRAGRRKDEFIAVLGHELRNPLAPLAMGVDLLQRVRSHPELIDTVQPMLSRQIDHLTRLVDDLLDIGRIERGQARLQPALLDLRDAVEAAIEQSRPLIDERHHRLDVDLDAVPLLVNGDFHRLTQVFGNLLANAAKYCGPGGVITVRSRRSDGEACIQVIDTGLGIPKEKLEEIFEIFHQVPEHRAAGGLGIGLAISRQLIELHGGHIEARSEGSGTGSVFLVRLPLVVAERGSTESVRNSTESMSQPGRRVLVVDDNTDAAESLRMVLEMHGHEVQTSYDGSRALDLVKSFMPEVVLLDLGLPGMDGFDVAKRIRSMPNGRAMRLIALTGWGQDEDRQQSAEAGFDEHLTKPIDGARLAELLTRHPERE